MVGPDDIGAAVVIAAADDFYSYVDGWRGTLDRFDECGRGVVLVPSPEFEGLILQFPVPPDQINRAE